MKGCRLGVGEGEGKGNEEDGKYEVEGDGDGKRRVQSHASSHASTFSRAGKCHLVAGAADQAVVEERCVATPIGEHNVDDERPDRLW
jgi:hypothetical protein